MSNLHKYYAEFSGEKEIVTAEPQEKIKPEPSSELSNLFPSKSVKAMSNV